MKHVLIVGGRHVGKTTLINKILNHQSRSVYGYRTKKEDGLRTEELGSPVYLYDISKPKVQTEDNKVGYCKNHKFQVNLDVFNRAAEILTGDIPRDGLILMDEIGFMESKAERFCEAVFQCLDGEIPVLAAVKHNGDFSFLEQVRNHPKCKCFYINEENRDELYEEVEKFVEENWNNEFVNID